MAIQLGDEGAYQSEINVTPLVDVVLVLLIIFMVVMPLTLRGYDVDIPRESLAAPGPADRVPEPIVLNIDATNCPVTEPPGAAGLPVDCSVRLNEDRVPVGDLAGTIANRFADREPADRVLFLAAEERLNYEGVMRIIDTAKSETNSLRIALVTRKGDIPI